MLQQIQQKHAENGLFGAHPNIPSDVYHRHDCPGYSSSFLKNVLRHSLGHALDWQKDKQSKSDSLLVGSALHDLVLQPHIFDSLWCVVPEGMRKDKRSKEYQAFLMDNSGKDALSHDQFETVQKMAFNLASHPKSSALRMGLVENTLWWTDEETGLHLKCRPDALLPDMGVIVDLKSTSDGREWAFSKSIHEYLYHLSAAMYVDGCIANGIPVHEFHLLAVENKFPHAVVWYKLDDAALEKGRQLYKKALWKIKEGLQEPTVPYYSTEIMTISLPAYGWTE